MDTWQQLIMAVFLLNHCKFNGCELSFPNLLELIQHIEETHIETITDPATEAVQETQQPSCLPLSSVLCSSAQVLLDLLHGSTLLAVRLLVVPRLKFPSSRYKNSWVILWKTYKYFEGDLITKVDIHVSVNLSKQEFISCLCGGKRQWEVLPRALAARVEEAQAWEVPVWVLHPPQKHSCQQISNSPPVSDCEETLHSDNEDSNDSWTTQDEIPAELIIKLASKGHSSSSGEDKPYVCPVVGCRKRYKNVNGIKYHAKNAHKKDSKVRKPYRCYCGKSYCTNQGLKNHCTHSHKNESLTAVTTNTGEVLQVPANQLSSASSSIGSQLLDNNNKPSTPPVSRSSLESEGTIQVSSTLLVLQSTVQLL
ncbi:uncharacterized protein LOC121877454 [Homarus americanus]|uniref:uncharacterized protein LOC121877454 n=1 Tax=Homarus americanus TaxID=6706 RepID=UPI001C43AF02|nr:uncharacterized protein LOC121877454 [Homarus americanus]